MDERDKQIEDLRKIHAEVNQIVNQRFNLTTLSLVVLGAFSGLLTPTLVQPTLSASQKVLLSEAVSVIEMTVFALLLWYFSTLSGMLRVFTTYLRSRKFSIWEADWAQYRENYHRYYHAYETSGVVILGLCGIVAWIYPGLLVWLLFPSDDLGAAAFAGATTILVIHLVLMARSAIPPRKLERELMENWSRILASNVRKSLALLGSSLGTVHVTQLDGRLCSIIATSTHSEATHLSF